MLGRREASSSSVGLRRSQFAFEGFEFWSSEGLVGKEILDDRELLLVWLLWLLWLVSESFMSFISVMRQVVSCCLAAGEGRVVVVIVRDSELVILTGR